ncbi:MULTISPECIES: glycosyltransferase family 4 protein [unclassified Rhizobium]|uniref:glycosyltransferase family 4 protein n=1 Tax=unclassified Rhizobium TaxID=2613769 RepID=UPI0016112543|nr:MULTISPECIES: glycosyltransferase family 4 protein [unclassified Rhizobium]MBB3542224.1 glycosyltransferase involved in cell wall biosynthesis [Rhizobium sp. BK399]MCS3738083.1 glycosyltransferase involved in cell wall biosynthesis [Rhizobium sp. BK661]MCS4092931.1 glycosyltransferase involved in cell wall biosynthesis [Rhizobium sp. BK176]
MNILHIAAHLGGGVGKAHSSLCSVDPTSIKRTYLLLEAPRDLRHVDLLKQVGADVVVAPDRKTISSMAAKADIVQVEWWNHPRLYECLCETAWPKMRTLFWSHISGIAAPYLPTGLLTGDDRFVFSSECSFAAPNVATLPPATRNRFGVVNSGFGLPPRTVDGVRRNGNSISYLGTVDFAKMSPDIFRVADEAATSEAPVRLWGEVSPLSEVVHTAAAMKDPRRVRFMGHTDNPADVFAQTSIFLYLLQTEHLGTAENALTEAMSSGCVPVVFNNPAEAAIVEDGRTGFIVSSIAEATERLRWMMRNPEAVAEMGRKAADHIATTRTPVSSAMAFEKIYADLLQVEKRRTDFRSRLGNTAAEWFLSTKTLATATLEKLDLRTGGRAAKGTIDHFLTCFPEDTSLLSLVAEPMDEDWSRDRFNCLSRDRECVVA